MIIFDIETRPLPAEQILADAPAFNESEVKTGNRKDPAKIAEHLAGEKAKYERNIIERAALDATSATVLAVGILDTTTDEEAILHGDEAEILASFWEHYHDTYPRHWVGFNSNRFDLPFIFRRCWHLGISISGWVYNGRYFDKRFVDLLAYWTFGNREERISLDRVARFLRLGRKRASGAQFAEMWDINREAAIEYLRNDLRLTAEVAKRLLALTEDVAPRGGSWSSDDCRADLTGFPELEDAL